MEASGQRLTDADTSTRGYHPDSLQYPAHGLSPGQSEHVEEDMGDLRALSDPSTVTQEQCEEFAAKTTERMWRLLETIRPREGQ